VAKITGIITKSTKGKSIFGQLQQCLGIIAGMSMSLVCGRNRSGRRMTEYQETGWSRGRMQQLETNAGRQ